MSEAAAVEAAPTEAARPPAFSPRTIVALVLVGVISFAALAVLAAYAPELRGSSDVSAHALSPSAVGFKGAVVMLQAEGVPTIVSRTEPRGAQQRAGLTVLTPNIDTDKARLVPFAGQPRVLIVLPKWAIAPQPGHIGWANKIDVAPTGSIASELLVANAPRTLVRLRQGVTSPRLHGAGGLFPPSTSWPLAPIDRFQTILGEGWTPLITDDEGRMVLVESVQHPNIVVLADPDLLNTQGLAKLDNARAGMAILHGLRQGQPVTFDVTLNGFGRGHGIGRLMLEPPWLAATLCGVAAAVLMGLHALARFGPVQARGRAIALGKRALVDNSAGLVRMAGREAELAPSYVAMTKAMVARLAGGGRRAATGADNDQWLAELARLRGAATPAELAQEADRAKTRDDLLAIGRKLYSWRLEITRERR